MNIHYFTLGCKVNQYETQAIREILNNKGNTDNTKSSADAIVINSCTVTAESDKKTRQLVRRCRRKSPQAIIVLTGCMVQAFPEHSKTLCEADIIIGNKDVAAVAEALINYQNEKVFSFKKHDKTDYYNTPAISDFGERTRAFVKIQDGCERYCTYCAIPKARGRIRSRRLDDLEIEVKNLAQNGYCEIVLVGINLSTFGKGENYNLCDAVELVSKIAGIKRIRLGSLEPDLMTDEMLSRLNAVDEFCPQFHLSLQSGCDETLKRMNRHYDSAFYEDLVARIRRTFKNSAVTTDIMVGFAGESDEEFEKSLEFARKIAFARTHVFVYSKRDGTIAANLPNQVPDSEKQIRAKRMAEVTTRCENEFLSKQIGHHFPVLFENFDGKYSYGYTENYTRVYVESSEDLCGKIIDVKLIKAENEICYGELI